MRSPREPTRRTPRPIPMRRTLGTLTAALLTCTALMLTAGCGSSSSSLATDPGSGPASDPAGSPWTPGPIPDAHVLPLISLTAAGGQATAVATSLNSKSEVDRFVAQFRMPAMRNRIRAAVAGEPRTSGHDVVGQVVSVGCDRPPGVDAMVHKDGKVQLVPHEVASPLEECLAAVTTVAIAVLPRD
jgi:hypothetical protein